MSSLEVMRRACRSGLSKILTTVIGREQVKKLENGFHELLIWSRSELSGHQGVMSVSAKQI